MLSTLARLFRDEDGFVLSAELVLLATIGVLAMVVGIAEVSNSVNNELHEVAVSFDSTNSSTFFADDGTPADDAMLTGPDMVCDE